MEILVLSLKMTYIQNKASFLDECARMVKKVNCSVLDLLKKSQLL